MGCVERIAHRPIQGVVTDHFGNAIGVGEIHELGEERRLRKREQSVEEHPAVLGQIDRGALVCSPELVEFEWPSAVDGSDDIPESCDLEEVAEFEVDGEALDHLLRVEMQLLNGPAPLCQPLLGLLVRPPLPLVGVVVDEGVVQVVADGPNGAEVERPVAVDRSSGVDGVHRADRIASQCRRTRRVRL